jgi:hypothetical protein
MPQAMCPICTAPFNTNDVIVRFWEWDKTKPAGNPKFAHVDCLLYLSKREEREILRRDRNDRVEPGLLHGANLARDHVLAHAPYPFPPTR